MTAWGTCYGFISIDGYILTNAHIVEHAHKILVKLSTGREHEGEVIGSDARTDIALIRIKPGDILPALPCGDSDTLRVGQRVLAIGSPLGREQTVHSGIINVQFNDSFIQTDALINPGNSGGPLLNMEGKVIGINTAITPSTPGIGFAIPINMAKSILPDLKAKGKVTRGWIGITVQDVTEDIASRLQLTDRRGAFVSEVFRRGPAARAGLRAGDLVTEVNAKKIYDTLKLVRTIMSFHAGEKIEVKALTDRQEKTFSIVVEEKKD